MGNNCCYRDNPAGKKENKTPDMVELNTTFNSTFNSAQQPRMDDFKLYLKKVVEVWSKYDTDSKGVIGIGQSGMLVEEVLGNMLVVDVEFEQEEFEEAWDAVAQDLEEYAKVPGKTISKTLLTPEQNATIVGILVRKHRTPSQYCLDIEESKTQTPMEVDFSRQSIVPKLNLHQEIKIKVFHTDNCIMIIPKATGFTKQECMSLYKSQIIRKTMELKDINS